MADGDNQYKKYKGFKRLLGDESNPTFGILVDDASKALHICEPADQNTDWNVSAASHPTIYLHSATSPATEYMSMYTDATTAHFNTLGSTWSFEIGGTAIATISATSFVLGSGVSFDLSGTTKLGLGTSGTPLALTVGSPILSVYSTCATTDSVAQPVIFNSVMTGAGGLGGRVRVNMSTNVSLGSYANAFKASIECNSVGGSTGLLSVGCFEVTMPTTGIAGTTTPIELEITYGATCGVLQKPCFIYANASGTAVTDFDTYGKFLILGTGVTAGAGKFLSADSLTLKCGTGALGNTLRYLFLSQIENGLGIGVSGTNVSYAAGSPLVAIYATSADTSSTNSQPFYLYSVMTGAGGYGGRSVFHTYTNVALTDNVMALKAYMEYGNAGTVGGLSAGFCTEMKIANASLGMSGAYFPLEIEYVAGGTSTTSQGSLTGNHVGWIYLNNSGDAGGDFDANGFFFHAKGLTAGSTKLLYNNTLKVGVVNTIWYLPLSSAEGSYTSAYPVSLSYTGEALALTGSARATFGTTGAHLSLTGALTAFNIFVDAVAPTGVVGGSAAYFDTTISGVVTGPFNYGFGNWVNLATSFDGTAVTCIIAAQNNGIYATTLTESATTDLVYGMRAECVTAATVRGLYAFSLNANPATSATYRALFYADQPECVGFTPTNRTTQIGSLAIAYINGTGHEHVIYVNCYEA